MKNSFLICLLLALSLSSVQASAFINKVESVTGNYCKDQLHYLMEGYFGQWVDIQDVNTKVSSSKYQRGKEMSGKEFWIKSNACEGYIVAETTVKASCELPHYGFVPLYIKRFWATGDCSKLIPHDVFPTERELHGLY